MSSTDLHWYRNGHLTDVHIEPTNACNFHCWMCPREVMTRPVGFMPMDQFKKLVDQLAKLDFLKHFHFGGFGEPTMHPDFFAMARYAVKQTDFVISVTTNASRFSEDTFIESFLETGIDKIILSHRHTADEKITKSLPSWLDYERYEQGLIDMVRHKFDTDAETEIDIAFLKPSIYGRLVLGMKGEDYIDQQRLDIFMEKLSKAIGKDLPAFSSLTGKAGLLSRINVLKALPGLNLRFDSLGAWTTSVEKYRDGCEEASHGSCMGMRTHFSIYENGDVSTCCGDFDVKNVLGNAFNTPLEEILQGKTARYFAKELAQNTMPSKACRICRGGRNRFEKWANMIGTLAAKPLSMSMWKQCLHQTLREDDKTS